MWSIFLLLTYFWHCSFAGFPYTTPTVGGLWPLPQNELPGLGSMSMVASTFSFVSIDNDCAILQNAYQRYLNILATQTSYRGKKSEQNSIYGYGKIGIPFNTLEVSVLQPCESLPHMNMDEQYELNICSPDNPLGATLISQSVWGALRGLETFSQLGIADGDGVTLNFNCTQILDFPRFSHRGILLDTSRHFLPVSTIKENLDLMAMNKFNVFHWHIVDDQSFPYESAVYPQLSALGAWSDMHIYTAAEIADIIDYATNLGIRVVSEFDSPGHTLSWGVGVPGLLTECYSGGVPDGTFGPIDPSNEANYVFLQELFLEVSNRFPDHYIHLGGDEVPFSCWSSNPGITDFMAAQNLTTYTELEEYYFNRLTSIIHDLPNQDGYIVWEEVFDNGVMIAPDTVIHVWKYEDQPENYYPVIEKVTAAGYQALLSSCWYLNYISYGTDWHKYYDCDPQGFNGTLAQKNLVMGGEAAMWGEYVDETNLTPRLWPRASTVAERLWSSAADTISSSAAAPRLEEHRCRLMRRGYAVESLGPSFCEGIL